MHDVGAGWLMTSLAPSPLMVSLVQAATTLPVFLLALPAGRARRYRRPTPPAARSSSAMACVALTLGLVVLAGKHQRRLDCSRLRLPWASGTALLAPAWQAIVPQLVPKSELRVAPIALNSVGINVSRAIGPALGGAVSCRLGLAWPFLLNAVSFLAVIAAVLWWRPPAQPARPLPAERFVGRHARRRALRALEPAAQGDARSRHRVLPVRQRVLGAAAADCARRNWAAMRELYGMLVTCIGIGAVAGAVLLPRLRKRLERDTLVVLGTPGTAGTLAMFAFARPRRRRPRSRACSRALRGSPCCRASTSRRRCRCPIGFARGDWRSTTQCSSVAMTLGSLSGGRWPESSGFRPR